MYKIEPSALKKGKTIFTRMNRDENVEMDDDSKED